MKLNAFVYASQLILILGATLLLIFIILSGGVDHFPFNKFYWLQADTAGIPNAPDLSRWSYWSLSSVENDKSVRFASGPAYPLSPADNFGRSPEIPRDFIDSRSTYFYLSRFAFAFYMIALAFVGIALLNSIFSLCSYSIIKTNSWLISVGLLFTTGATCFQTAVSVLARSTFHDANRAAKLGPSLFGITWAAVAVLIILFFHAWGGLISASYKKHQERVNASKSEYGNPQQYSADQQDQAAQVPASAEDQNQGTVGNESSGIKFFKIRRHNKEDTESV